LLDGVRRQGRMREWLGANASFRRYVLTEIERNADAQWP
jgi:hypothetical protein